MSSPSPGLVPSFRAKNNPMDEPQVTPLSELGPQCEAQRERIRKLFESGAGARETLRQLCELADGTIKKVYGELLRVRSAPAQGMALLALGGYGREMLFPYSDLDLLFLFGNEKAEDEFRPLISEFSRTLWDLGFRVSSAGRTLLFPYSDLDLLFLFGNEKAEDEFRPLISEFSRTLWDLGFRVSSAGR